ncbi:MAG: O-antigen/teichoic acid export membrane protein [Psychromonas sp.]|uniref:lipopolysaccharide biosynthesis protein n=1 Tax=Psychromonas sp. TaxID=1884585 RepID=UPI0039E63AF6
MEYWGYQKLTFESGRILLKNTLIYTFSSILSAGIPFLLVPILTRYLSPEQYGQIAMFTIFLTALTAVVGLSVDGAANRRFFDQNVTCDQLKRFNGNCFFILLTSTVLASFILLFVDAHLAHFLGIPSSWVYLGILSVFCSFILKLRLGQLQVRGKAKSYGFFQVVNSFVVLILSILFVVSLDLGGAGRIYSIVLTSVLVSFMSFYSLVNDKLFKFEYCLQDIKQALSFGVPLIPHVLGAFLLLSADKFVINKELGLEMTGIYMVAFSLGSALNIIFSGINSAFTPWLFGQLKEDDEVKKRDIVKKTYLYFIFLIFLSLFTFIVAPPILKLIVGEKFHQAAEVLPLIIVGQVFLGMYFMVTNYIFYVKKTKYLSYVTISSGAINISLLLLFLPIYGIYGAALAFSIANLWQFLFTWLVSAKVYSMPWALWRV